MWRKNRRNNGGSYGVDLNRNFGYQWGYDNNGSSPTASSDTYRGPSANSELETQAFRNFVNARPIAAMQSYHSYSNLMIYPYGYTDIQCEEPWHTGYVAMTNLLSAGNGYGPAARPGNCSTTRMATRWTGATGPPANTPGSCPSPRKWARAATGSGPPSPAFPRWWPRTWSRTCSLPRWRATPGAPCLPRPRPWRNPATSAARTRWPGARRSPDANNPAVSYEVQQLSGLQPGHGHLHRRGQLDTRHSRLRAQHGPLLQCTQQLLRRHGPQPQRHQRAERAACRSRPACRSRCGRGTTSRTTGTTGMWKCPRTA
jgi:hypothetical protein